MQIKALCLVSVPVSAEPRMDAFQTHLASGGFASAWKSIQEVAAGYWLRI